MNTIFVISDPKLVEITRGANLMPDYKVTFFLYLFIHVSLLAANA